MTQPTTAPLVGRVTTSQSSPSSSFTTYVSEEAPKLCGFLLKQSDSSSAVSKAATSAAATIGFPAVANAGRLPSRKRWFVFNETTCRLYWYKSPNDLDSLGDVDIISAAFEVVVGETNQLTTFKINTKEKTVVLEAPDSKTMMYWLQELQSQRMKHVKTLTRNGPPGMRIPRPPSPRTRRKISPSVIAVDRAGNNDDNASSVTDNLIDLDNNSNYDRLDNNSVETEISSSNQSTKMLQSDNEGGGARPSNFDDLLPRVEAPVDSVGFGSAVVGGGPSLFRRESLTKKSLRGKMMKFLPGKKDEADVSVTTTTTENSPRAANVSNAETEIAGNELRRLNKSPDLHRRAAAAASSTSIAASSTTTFASPQNAHPRVPVASIQIEILSTSRVSSSQVTSSSAVPTSAQFYPYVDAANFPYFGSSTTSLPDASNQNSFTSGLSNLFKQKNGSPSVSNSNLSSPPCQRCHALADQLRVSFKEIESLRDERDAQRDCHNILTQQLEFQQRKLDARQSKEGDSSQWAEDREQELLHLKSVLQKNQEDLDIRKRKVETLEAEAAKAKDQIEMLQELIKCKDEVVCKLTDQLFEVENQSKQVPVVDSLSTTAPTPTRPAPTPTRPAPTPTRPAPTPSRGANSIFPRMNSSNNQPPPTTCDHCENQIQDLESELAAYKFQNQVCNKEILEQNQLRTELHDWGRQLCEQLVEYEAKLCQAKSERDFLLNEKSKARKSASNSHHDSTGDDGADDVLERMIEDAMEESVVEGASRGSKTTRGVVSHIGGDDQSALSSNSKMDRNGLYYDEYGFLKGQNASSASYENDALLAKAKSFDIYSRDLQDSLGEPGDYEVSRRVKWENFMTSQWAISGGSGANADLVRSPELKTLVRMGIPSQYRWNIWRSCAVHWLGGKDEDLGGQSWASKIGSSYYKDLVDASDSKKPTATLTRDGTLTSASILQPIEKQIELDLLRTLPNNKHFGNINSDLIQKLRRVLRAYARHNISVGYCQGMNRLAAIPLLILPSEEDAFWLLVAIIDHIMPESYYGSALIAAQADQRVLKDLLAEKIPRLAAHLDRLAVDLSLFTFNWFLCLFVDTIPPEVYLKIWDTFLYEGPKVLFRFALAFLKLQEENLLAASDYLTVCAILRALGEDALTCDWRLVSHVAFETLNPFPLRNIKNRRKTCVAQVKQELEELESIRQKYRRESKRDKRDGDDDGNAISESEDET